jgi:hypothetical protein
MKKIIIYAALLLAASCGSRPEFDQEVIKCRVDTCIMQYRYPGLLPDYTYVVKTSCGYTLASKVPYQQNDSVTFQIRTPKK